LKRAEKAEAETPRKRNLKKLSPRGKPGDAWQPLFFMNARSSFSGARDDGAVLGRD
jgi:hypothetical protein